MKKSQKETVNNLANGAIYILSKEFFLLLEKKFMHAKDFSIDIMPKLKFKSFVYETKHQFIDIGTIKNLNLVNKT